MSYFHIESSRDAKPQSIFHQIGRLGSKLTKPITRRRKLMKMKQELRKSASKSCAESTAADSDVSSLQIYSEASRDNCSVDFPFAPATICEDDVVVGDCKTTDEDDASSFFDENDTIFATLDQNQFLLECFLANEKSDVIFLVHFFNQETSISNSIEDILSIRVMEKQCNIECRKINSKSAPLFTAKLQIDPEQPTVVAIKNGRVLSKVSDVSSAKCVEVEQWLARTRLLETDTRSRTSTFSGL